MAPLKCLASAIQSSFIYNSDFIFID